MGAPERLSAPLLYCLVGAKNGLFQPLCRSFLDARQEMAICVERDVDLAVPKPLSYHLRVFALQE